jgi:Tol biopolymer transport system component
MDEQRIERALRTGPPFGTQYAARSLPLELPEAPPAAIRRVLLGLAVVGLVLAAALATLVIGALRPAPLALTCADAARAIATPARSWTSGPPAAPLAEAKAGMLVADDRHGRLALIDPNTGANCATLELGDGREAFGQIEWSIDGSALAFVGHTPGGDGVYDLLVLSSAGLVRSALRSDLPLDFAWSPDGATLATFTSFSRTAGGGTQVGVWVVPADGSSPRQIAFDCARCTADQGSVRGWADAIAWSPDSTRLALAFQRATDVQTELSVPRRWGLWVSSRVGGRLAEVGELRDLALDRWLDDATVLANDPVGGQFVMSVDSGGVVGAPEGTPKPRISEDGTLSPDGRTRAFVDGDGALRVTDLATETSRTIARDPRFAFTPVIWAPDGRSIALGSDAGGIWIIDVGDGTIRQLADRDVHPVVWQAVRGAP